MQVLAVYRCVITESEKEIVQNIQAIFNQTPVINTWRTIMQKLFQTSKRYDDRRRTFTVY